MSYMISEIERLYPDWYNKDSALPRHDQQWIWENLPLPKEDQDKLRNTTSGVSVSLNGSVNGTYRFRVDSELFPNKNGVISQLKACRSKDSPRDVSLLLEELFSDWQSKEGHWLYVAQQWTPRSINWVLVELLKQHIRGETTIKNPPAYFTLLIKSRRPRKRVSNPIKSEHQW